jgi:hypothetical protein
VELPVEKVKMSARRCMVLADKKKRTQTVAMAAQRTIRAELVANRPRPDPTPPIRGLWRGRRCSRSSACSPTARVSTQPCWNSDSAPLAARRPPRPYARRPSLPAWPGEGGRRRGGEQGERGLQGRGGGDARVQATGEGSEARVASALHLLHAWWI